MQTIKVVSRIVKDISKEQIFAIWSDVNNWHRFNHGIEYAKLEGAFKEGEYFTLGVKNGKSVRIKLIEVSENRSFTDMTAFPLAKMYGIHELIEREDGLEVKATLKMKGILSLFWKRVVVQKVAEKMEDDMESLLELAGAKRE